MLPRAGDGTGSLLEGSISGGIPLAWQHGHWEPCGHGYHSQALVETLWGRCCGAGSSHGGRREWGQSPRAGCPRAQPGHASVPSGSQLCHCSTGHGHVPSLFAPGGHPGYHPPFHWEGHRAEPRGTGKHEQDQCRDLFYSLLGIHITSLTRWLRTRISFGSSRLVLL